MTVSPADPPASADAAGARGPGLTAVRGSVEELAARHHVSRRLAVRAAALAARGLGLTAVLLETAAADVLLSKLLLAGATLRGVTDPEALLQLIAAHNRAAVLADSPTLDLVDDPGAGAARLLCLEEELLVARAWSDSAVLRVAQPASALALAAEPARGELVEAGEVAALQRTLHTASDSGKRIEALTALVTLAPLEPRQRAGLLLEAMTSRREEVARAALELLGAAGLPATVTDALADLDSTSPALRAHAVDRLRKLVAAADTEPLCLAAVLLAARRVLWNESEVSARRALVLLLGEATRGQVASAANVREVVRTLVKVSLDAPAALSLTVRLAVLRLAAEAPAATLASLQEEVAALDDEQVAIYILALIGELPLAGAALAAFCDDLVARVLAGGSAGIPNLAQLEAGLRRHPDAGLRALLPRLPAASRDGAAEIVVLVDRLAMRLEPAATPLHATARRALLELLETASPGCARAILDSRLLAREALDAGDARLTARELVARMHFLLLPDVWEACRATFTRLGRHALAPVTELLHAPGTSAEDARRALELLGASCEPAAAACAYDAEHRRQALELLEEVLSAQPRDEQLRLAAAAAAGALLAAATTPFPELRPALARLEPLLDRDERMHLWAVLAARADLPAADAAQLEAEMREVLASFSPSADELLVPVASEERPWTGKVFAATGADRDYSVLLPAAIDGLAARARGAVAEGIAGAKPDARRFRNHYAALLAAWRRVAPEDLWGPSCTGLLVVRLSALAAHPRAPESVRRVFLETFVVRARILHADEGDLVVVRAAPAVLEGAPAKLVREHAFRVLELLVTARHQALAFEEAERAVLLDAITRIAALRHLTANADDGARLAVQVASQAQSALRSGHPLASTWAERALACKLLPADRRQELAETLARSRALVVQ